jgi:hypothetical protein
MTLQMMTMIMDLQGAVLGTYTSHSLTLILTQRLIPFFLMKSGMSMISTLTLLLLCIPSKHISTPFIPHATSSIPLPLMMMTYLQWPHTKLLQISTPLSLLRRRTMLLWPHSLQLMMMILLVPGSILHIT